MMEKGEDVTIRTVGSLFDGKTGEVVEVLKEWGSISRVGIKFPGREDIIFFGENEVEKPKRREE